jgi:hypothetical protein
MGSRAEPVDRAALWRRAIASPAIWRRALVVALPVGVMQVAVNQGDVWVRHLFHGGQAGPSLLVKTLASPLITVTVAVVSAALEFVHRERERGESKS